MNAKGLVSSIVFFLAEVGGLLLLGTYAPERVVNILLGGIAGFGIFYLAFRFGLWVSRD